MINPNQIAIQVAMRPFRKFAMQTLGGQQIVVLSADRIMLPPARSDLMTVYDNNGFVYLVPINEIVSLSIHGPEPVQEQPPQD